MKSQQELERMAQACEKKARAAYIFSSGSLGLLLLSLLRCLLNPLSAIGLYAPGLLAAIAFLCLLAWQWQAGNRDTACELLLWWLVWAILAYAAGILLRALSWRTARARLRLYMQAEATAEEPLPDGAAPAWQWNGESGQWQAQAPVFAPQQGLYAWRLDVEDTACTLCAPLPTACGLIENAVPGLRNSYQIICRLEPGCHLLRLSLKAPIGKTTNGSAPPETSLTRI